MSERTFRNGDALIAALLAESALRLGLPWRCIHPVVIGDVDDICSDLANPGSEFCDKHTP